MIPPRLAKRLGWPRKKPLARGLCNRARLQSCRLGQQNQWALAPAGCPLGQIPMKSSLFPHLVEPCQGPAGTGAGCTAMACVRCEMSAGNSSEGLPQAEEEVEVTGLADMGRKSWIRVIVGHGVDGRVEVIAEVKPDGSHRRMVAHPQAGRVREVVEAAGALYTRRCGGAGRRVGGSRGRDRVLASLLIGLVDPQGTRPGI